MKMSVEIKTISSKDTQKSLKMLQQEHIERVKYYDVDFQMNTHSFLFTHNFSLTRDVFLDHCPMDHWHVSKFTIYVILKKITIFLKLKFLKKLRYGVTFF